MATPPTPTSGALTVNSTTGVILSPVTATLFKSANGIGSGTGDVTASGTLTANALILGGGTTVVTASALTYSGTTLSVPDAFVVSSAGSIGLTAGGSNKSITLTPSGSTASIIGKFNTTTNLIGLNGLDLQGADADFLVLNMNTYGGFSPFIIGRAARGTAAVPTATTSGLNLMQISGRGYGTAFTGTRASISLAASELWTATANGTQIGFLVVPNGTASGITPLVLENSGRAAFAPSNSSLSAWGVNGTGISVAAATKTDSSSSGTVATAVANSFAVPTFAASSATTFTNAANLYIAGDVANGSNVTLTNSYGLWNAGKTRLDGVTSVTNATASSSTTTGALLITGGIGIGDSLYAGGGIFSTSVTGQPVMQNTAATTNQKLIRLQNTGGDFYFGVENSAASFFGAPVAYSSVLYSPNNPLWIRSTLTTLSGDLTVSGGDLILSGASTLTGGAGNMTITAGTGASRTLTLRTTTAGSTATNWLVGDASQNTTAGGSITTSTPNGGTAGAWKFGIRVAAVSALDTTQYIQLDVGGTLYKLALIA